MVVKRKSKGWSVDVDFEGVESGGFNLEDGTYAAEITKAESTESSEGNPMIVVSWVVTDGPKKGTKLNYDNISLLPQALWKLKALLEALGVEVPDSSLSVEESDLVGGECSIEVTNETYAGKERPKITGYVSSEDVPEGEEEDEKPAKSSSKKKTAKKDEDEEGDDDDGEDEKVGKKPSETVKKTSKKDEPEFEEGDRVKFRDDKDKLVKGKVVEIDGEMAKVEDASGDVWELEVSSLEAA
jgi:Protein of unknown function (DUF669)